MACICCRIISTSLSVASCVKLNTPQDGVNTSALVLGKWADLKTNTKPSPLCARVVSTTEKTVWEAAGTHLDVALVDSRELLDAGGVDLAHGAHEAQLRGERR